MATTQDKDDKDSPKKKKGTKDLDDLKKEVPLVRLIDRVVFTVMFNLLFFNKCCFLTHFLDRTQDVS